MLAQDYLYSNYEETHPYDGQILSDYMERFFRDADNVLPIVHRYIIRKVKAKFCP